MTNFEKVIEEIKIESCKWLNKQEENIHGVAVGFDIKPEDIKIEGVTQENIEVLGKGEKKIEDFIVKLTAISIKIEEKKWWETIFRR